jgi:hypothetical protein
MSLSLCPRWTGSTRWAEWLVLMPALGVLTFGGYFAGFPPAVMLSLLQAIRLLQADTVHVQRVSALLLDRWVALDATRKVWPDAIRNVWPDAIRNVWPDAIRNVWLCPAEIQGSMSCA